MRQLSACIAYSGDGRWIQVVIALLLLAGWRCLFSICSDLRFTTLAPAGRWAISASILWTGTWLLDRVGLCLTTAVADHLWYACAVVALCPAISVLGSRRPGTRVWTWFILVPMLFTLGWPVLTLLIQGRAERGLQIETPQLMGYFLVLVMGAGNYLGTRHTFSALCYMAAAGLLVVTSSAAFSLRFIDDETSRTLAIALMATALVLGRPQRPQSLGDRFDTLWSDFFHQFGIVWGRRIQDRLNFIAEKEGWPGRLELDGFHWNAPRTPEIDARVEHALRWLLRRFADPEWLDRRLGSMKVQISPLAADS